MKRTGKIIAGFISAAVLAAGAVGFGAPGNAGAAEASVSADLLTNYVWRGQKLSDDHGVVQPAVEVSHRGFSAGYWANFDLESGENTETDLTLGWSGSANEIIAVGAGYIHYGLDGAADTQEVYVSVGADILLSPALDLYYDFDEGEGAFMVASVCHSLALPELMGRAASLNLGASASVNFENSVMGAGADGEDFTGFYNGELSASVSIDAGGGVTIEPKAAWSFALSDDAEAAIESVSFDSDSSHAYGGVNVSYGF